MLLILIDLISVTSAPVECSLEILPIDYGRFFIKNLLICKDYDKLQQKWPVRYHLQPLIIKLGLFQVDDLHVEIEDEITDDEEAEKPKSPPNCLFVTIRGLQQLLAPLRYLLTVFIIFRFRLPTRLILLFLPIQQELLRRHGIL